MPIVRSKSSGIRGKVPGTGETFCVLPVYGEVSDSVADHLKKAVGGLVDFLPTAKTTSAPGKTESLVADESPRRPSLRRRKPEEE